MKIYSAYSVKIKHYNHIFKSTVEIYRHAVDFYIGVALKEWENLSEIGNIQYQKAYLQECTIRTKQHPNPWYPFEDAHRCFYKMPVYLRRAAIAEALGKVHSYKSNVGNWKTTKTGRKPSVPKAGYVFPALYRGNMYVQTDAYKANIKVYVRNTWDFISVDLKKSDMDYIRKHCGNRKHCVPTLQKRGKEWFLDFSFEEEVKLPVVKVREQTIVSVDLGINNAASVSVMKADGTILGRHFYKLPKETDSLHHSINRIKKAQQHGNYKTPRLWNKAKGINHDIAVKTAHFIMEIAVLYNADVVVFEHLHRGGKLKGSKKQKLHLWKSQSVQSMVTHKAHRLGIRISRVNAWGTSKYAFDGSGMVERGINGNYSICKFQNGKIYNCDLSATYNIGARYFIREILKSLPAKARLLVEAKVPQCSKRSTCTFSALVSLNAVLLSA